MLLLVLLLDFLHQVVKKVVEEEEEGEERILLFQSLLMMHYHLQALLLIFHQCFIHYMLEQVQEVIAQVLGLLLPPLLFFQHQLLCHFLHYQQMKKMINSLKKFIGITK